jgi:hypothetical protein
VRDWAGADEQELEPVVEVAKKQQVKNDKKGKGKGKGKGKAAVGLPTEEVSAAEESGDEDVVASDDEADLPTFAGVDEDDLNEEDEDVEVDAEPEFDGKPINRPCLGTSADLSRLQSA